MNIIEAILRVLRPERMKSGTDLPGWRGRPPQTKKLRIPFSSTRKRAGIHNMERETFLNRESRDLRWSKLRSERPHVIRCTTIDGKGGILWIVAYPRV